MKDERSRPWLKNMMIFLMIYGLCALVYDAIRALRVIL